MTRLDDLLGGERARTEGLEVQTPSYDALRARGFRRRQRRRAAGVTGVAGLVAAVVLGGQAILQGPTSPEVAPPATSVAPGPTPGGPSLRPPVPPQGTDPAAPSPDPVLHTLAVDPDDVDVRAGLWQRCARRCPGGKWELLLTRDGFDTSVSVVVPGRSTPTVTALEGGRFHVAGVDGAQVVRSDDGSTAPVTTQGEPGPLAAGELVVRSDSVAGVHVALDPVTGAAHPLSVPDDVIELTAQPDGALLGWSWSQEAGTRVVWSSDSGRTWRDRVLADSAMLQVLPSARPGTLAVVEGADGATLFPMVRLHRSSDGGDTWETVELERGPRAYVGAGGVAPDGRLVIDVEAWSGEGGRVGVHASRGEDWSTLVPTRGRPASAQQEVGMTATRDGLVVSAISDGVGVVDVSRDAGESWQRLLAR